MPGKEIEFLAIISRNGKALLKILVSWASDVLLY
jgi:hypothetical protein